VLTPDNPAFGKTVNTISVMSLNLRFGLADDGPNGWVHRKESVVRLFRKRSPDFIATQEGNHFQVDFLTKSLPEYNHIGRRRPAPGFWQDNVLFYKKTVACTNEVHFFLSETPRVPSRSFGSRFPRQATLGLFDINGQSLICVDTHFDFDPPAQMGAARVIVQQLALQDDRAPTILLGDFNATPDSPCYQWLTGKDAEGKEGPGFRETFAAPYPGTHHGFTGKPTGDHIDWILFRGPLQLLDSQVLQEPVNGVHPSDHFPVTAVFQLRQPEE
jgi:endonuclease/exonuclease/phosphatase family metal-dependent hydrolase